ncbi:MAG: 8-oxo-dGTP diphosphatase MutT [Acidobacteria bacterium]|jgi:8-oxo-dGTP diphosphatase|nr:8-oxo-dGTP diphosphatase MutT [Acidobacteriota bacterium]
MAHTKEPKREITVVAAVIRDVEGRVLLTQRPKGRHMGGLWEFPGGKINRGEHPTEALIRELDEELGIKIAVDEPLTFAVHEEHDLRILLLFFRAHILAGSPRGREGQSLRWVAVSDLPSYRTPPADARLVRLLGGNEAP